MVNFINSWFRVGSYLNWEDLVDHKKGRRRRRRTILLQEVSIELKIKKGEMEKVDIGWFEAQYDIFAYLGLLTFLFLMSLLVFAVVMSICCWLCLGGRRLDKQTKKEC